MATNLPIRPVGSVCATKSLYNHSASPRHDKWSEFKDPIEEEQRIKALGQAYAVVHRFSRVEPEDGDPSWQTHSIEIKSPRLQKIMLEVLADYPNWNPDATPFTFFPPFKPIVHRWDKILEAVKKHEQDPSVASELRLLRSEFAPLLAGRLSALKHAKNTGLVSFHTLWLTFAPGVPVLASEGQSACARRLVSMVLVSPVKPHTPYWVITVETLDWNGSACGFVSTEHRIDQFHGEILATKLELCPLDLAPDSHVIRSALLARGRRFESLRGFHVVNCSGKKFVIEVIDKEERIRPKPVSGRVVVDAFAFYRCQEKVMPKLKQLDSTKPKAPKESSAKDNDRNGPASKDREEDLQPLSDAECILATTRVKGFDLRTKEWGYFAIDEITDTKWLNTAYENLVLPEGEKDLLFAFADHPRLHKKDFDDFVQEKGQGIIILLCGPPGVGKTLSAEAVAERSKVPLFVLTAGDLGINPDKVEKTLNNALECCRLWDAVLLLDEADVFLECRRADSLARNELTSIFLRRLEYYRGLMFLTTNRLDAIDPAFKSRLDLILPYQDLDQPARRSVWVNFISSLTAGTWELSDKDFDKLSESMLNGREIKNSVKTALVLAAHDGGLKMKHLETVLGIRERVRHFQ